MSFRVTQTPQGVLVRLSGWDMAMVWRRETLFPYKPVTDVGLLKRGVLEPLIDHRVIGVGTHSGEFRPGRRRVGTMLGRDVQGKQFWAVGHSPPDLDLLVLDLAGHEFVRAVLSVDDPDARRAEIAGMIG